METKHLKPTFGETLQSIYDIFQKQRTIKIAELVQELNRGRFWISKHLKLDLLDVQTEEMVHNGRICVFNAHQLIKLPKEEQVFFAGRALTCDPAEFCGLIMLRLKELKCAKRRSR